MASSLRKLGKRLRRTSPPDIPGADEREPQRLRQDSPDKEEPPTATNDYSIPAPPPQTLQRDHKKNPPSKELQKYKSKSSAAMFATLPNPGQPETVGKTTSSCEDITKEPIAEGGTISKPPRLPTVRRVSAQGCEFDMMEVDSADPMESVEDLRTTTRQPASEGPMRTTRSNTRRQQRADSLREDQDNISAKTFATSNKSQDSLKVPSLTIRKQGNMIPASGSKTVPANSQSDRRKSTESPRTPSPRDTTPPSPTAPRVNFSRPTPSPSPTDTTDTTHHSSSSLVEAYKASTSLSIPETIVDENETTKACRSFHDDEIRPAPIETVKVRPPIYDVMKTAVQQWEHFGITSSRPERAWDGSIRWTCCVCEAQTIVEQLVCASLECGHDRCYNRCQVLKETKKNGLFYRG